MSKVYIFYVLETQVVEKIYRVEAENGQEAREKAERGETLSEEEVKIVGVQDRNILKD